MRLIDADELCNALLDRWHTADKNAEKTIIGVMADIVTPIVVGTPTIDAVPIVRCKDCKYKSTCLQSESYGDNGYCSFGEK